MSLNVPQLRCMYLPFDLRLNSKEGNEGDPFAYVDPNMEFEDACNHTPGEIDRRLSTRPLLPHGDRMLLARVA